MSNLYTQHSLPVKLLEASNEETYDNVELWSATLGNGNDYNCYVFIVSLLTENNLSLHWEQYRNDIATGFQIDLVKEIEIWNIYLFFVIEGAVSRDLKFRIEQDKYSSRKVVLSQSTGQYDHLFTAGKLDVSTLLDNFLFEVPIGKSTGTEDTLKELIESLDPDIVTVLQDYTPGIKKQKDFYQNYLTKKNIPNETKGN